MIRCDFCGYEFDPACTEKSCRGCPISKSCGQIICPRCGYPTLPEAKLIGWLRAAFQRKPASKQTQVKDIQ